MAEKDQTLTSLKDIISNLLESSAIPFNPDDVHIWEVWEEAVGTAIANHAQPSWIREGRLRVNVSDPIWLQELEFAGEKIIEKLNEKLGRRAVEKVEFRLGTI